jgi:hypothetical protein
MMGWMASVRHLGARMVVGETHHRGKPSTDEIRTMGLDLAKHVFQVHGVDASGAVRRPTMRFVAIKRWPSMVVAVAGEQDGAHRLGGDASRGELPAAGGGGISRGRMESLREDNGA